MTKIKVTNLLTGPSRDKIATPSKSTPTDVESGHTDEQEETKQSIIINVVIVNCTYSTIVYHCVN